MLSFSLFKHRALRWLLPLLFFVTASCISYRLLLFQFFEQDEWMDLGHIYSRGLGTLAESGIARTLLFGEGRPISKLLNYFFYTTFGLNTLPLGIFSMLVHGFAAFFFFLILQKIQPNKWFNVFATLIFLMNVTSFQSVSWFSAAVSVPVASLLLFISILFYLESFGEKYVKRNRWLSYLFFYLSFLTKEVNVLFSLFFVAYYFLYVDHQIVKNIKTNIVFLGITILAFTKYVLFYFSPHQQHESLIISQQASGGGVMTILQNAVLFPLETFSQSFIPPLKMFAWARYVNLTYFKGTLGPLYVEDQLSSYLSIGVTIGFILFFFLVFFAKRLNKKIFILGLVFYFTTVLPYVIIQKGNAYLEGRYYYLPLAGAAMMLSSWEIQKHRKILQGVVAIILILYLSFQYQNLQEELHTKITAAKTRRDVITEIQKMPVKDKKINIFFAENTVDPTTGTSFSFVSPGEKLPLQQGVGYTLLATFYPEGVVPKEMLLNEKEYMWGMNEEGYLTSGDYGFGYFYTPEKLKTQLSTLKLNSYNLFKLNYYRNQLQVQKISSN